MSETSRDNPGPQRTSAGESLEARARAIATQEQNQRDQMRFQMDLAEQPRSSRPSTALKAFKSESTLHEFAINDSHTSMEQLGTAALNQSVSHNSINEGEFSTSKSFSRSEGLNELNIDLAGLPVDDPRVIAAKHQEEQNMRMVSLKGSISGNSHNLSGSRFDEVDRGKEVTRPSQARSPSYSNASDIKEPMPERHNSGGRSDSEIEDDEALSLDGTDESHSQTHSTSPSDDPTAKFANESERPTAPQKSGATAGAVSRPQQQSAGTDSERASKTNGKGNPAVSKSQNPQSTMQSNRQGDLPPEDVPRDVQELFAYIEGYQPEVVDLVTELKCFLPDYIPSIGDIDPMIKIPPPRPIDTSKSKDSFSELSLLGITVIDEPAANQTDSAILDLQLRSAHKSAASAAPQHVRSIQFTSTAESKGYKSLSQWIQNIYNLHLQKPPDTVTYSKRMPEIETLMAEWPAEIESLLSSGEMQVPPPEINLPLGEYATLLCELLDVPVHRSAKSEASSGKKPAGGAKNSKTAYIESLHLLFTLYCEFKASQHFGRTIHGGAERSV